MVAASGLGESVYLKLENLQRTGSFKLRGAVNVCVNLDAEDRARGIVVASAGNHGAGMAIACRRAGISLRVLVPETTPANKRDKIGSYGADVLVRGANYDAAEAAARAEAQASGSVFVSPFDDPAIVAGNGDSLALEILEQRPDVATVIASVGGGGMISGLARTLAPRGVVVVGAQPENNCAMRDSLALGRALTEYEGQPTVAEGCDGAVAERTYEICREHLNSLVTVSESDIEAAVAYAFRSLGQVLECTGAVALAGLITAACQPKGPTVCLLSGANIDDNELKRILASH